MHFPAFLRIPVQVKSTCVFLHPYINIKEELNLSLKIQERQTEFKGPNNKASFACFFKH